MPERLTERYDVEKIRLRPDSNEHALHLVEIIESLRPGGLVFHLLAHTPSSDSELFVVLIDDQSVLSFELPKPEGAPEDITHYTFDEYRREIGQGRSRILLDRAAQAARDIASASRS